MQRTPWADHGRIHPPMGAEILSGTYTIHSSLAHRMWACQAPSTAPAGCGHQLETHQLLNKCTHRVGASPYTLGPTTPQSH